MLLSCSNFHFIYSSAISPPPSYDDTVTQEHSATASISSQFVVPVQVTDAAVVHGQYGININFRFINIFMQKSIHQ